MNAWLTRLCRKAPLPQGLRTTPPAMAIANIVETPLAAAAALAAPDLAPASPAEAGACGWFNSSLDLRDGLAVSELRNPDWTVLVLWFGPAALRTPAHLH